MDGQNKIYKKDKCLTVKELKLYAKKQVSAQEEKLFYQHIKNCELCKDAVEGYKYLKENNFETKISFLNKRIQRRSSYYTASKGKIFSHAGFHRWISVASIIFTIIIIFGALHYINYAWKEFSKQESDQYIEQKEAENHHPNNDKLIIPAKYKGGEMVFINEFKEMLSNENIVLKENLSIEFVLTKNGEIENIVIFTSLPNKERIMIKHILKESKRWLRATKNDQFVDYKIEVVIPAI